MTKQSSRYGDWFDRYPHGVSGTDYEEPSAEIKKEPGADAVLGQKSDLQRVEESLHERLSPPSRAAVQDKSTQHRKMAKRRHSKTQSKQSNASTSQQQQSQQQEAALEQDRRPSVEEMMAAQAFQPNMGALSQHSTAFPPGFQPPPNPLLLTPPQQQMMSQLDRQMVLNSYAGINQPSHPGFNTLGNNNGNPMLDPSLDNFDFHSMSNNGNIWGDPSSAWFMPFNMDPPAHW